MFLFGSLLLGFSLGGLVDGIVLHQVLQWHNFVSAEVPTDTVSALRTNLFWDGVFHLATTALLVVAVALLWGARGRSATGGKRLLGLTLVGWGVFHVVDQIVFHEVLGLHDIRQGVANPGLYNWTYFAVGLLLVVVGVVIAGSRTRSA
ncbi:MAG TPA: DUF2243 domain-containing protein [Egibacteraceae bacterium]|nr:DUF2243 domain-containing protein [Egibacteraceae bacterium]HVM14614.1 DUF2243 domain-containing protein [Egibacteraceae bacterium]HVM18640.1 DUF2243 domain-containing protein [Egibacteraceae bacterium]